MRGLRSQAMTDASTSHPSAKELADFGLGKLPRPRCDAIAEHLENCPGCLAKLSRQQPDTFMGRLRSAASKNDTVLPGVKTPETPPKNTPPADFPPELAELGKFLDPKKVGEGGMGTVWRARHVLLDKDVAIKVMHSAALGNAEARDRFFTEMRAGGKLDHPNIARIIDADRVDTLLYLVMEYVEGRSLEKYVARKGPMPAGLACDLAAQAALGLQHAYEKGMAHRDIKPGNLMVTREAVVKLLDFGLVRLAEEGQARKTRFQAFMGTADYVAPEQALNARDADIRSDIYSLGCTLYFLLAGKPPFTGETFFEVTSKHVTDPPTPLATVAPGLWAVIARMMAKQREDRYQTPAEVVQALQPFRGRGAVEESGPLSMPPPVPSVPLFTDFAADTQTTPRTSRRQRGGAGWRLSLAVGSAVALAALMIAGAVAIVRSADRTPEVKEPPVEPPPAIVELRARFENDAGMTMVLLPGGTFLMGSPEREAHPNIDEKQHSVTISKFYIATTEVTQRQFHSVTDYNPSYFTKHPKGTPAADYKHGAPGGGKDKLKESDDTWKFPVENLSWHEAKDFCD
jgi:serine/threonine protein kinase